MAGQWVALGPDPYGFELVSDGSQLSGEGCLGGLRSQGDPLVCSPLSIQADRGKRLAFLWDMNLSTQPSGISYVVQMELTLSPERTAMAGKVWTSLSSNGEPQDIVLVRYPGQPVPPATECSGGGPSGACFLGPLRTDRIDELRVVPLGGGDLLIVWRNQRGVGGRIGSARFDAAAGTWEDAEFLDDGSAGVDFTLLATSPQGWARIAYVQSNELVTRGYDPKLNAWSEQQTVDASDDPAATPRPHELFVYDGGDATLMASAQAPDGTTALSVHDYVAKTDLWKSPHLVVGSPGASDWAAASDTDRNQLVLWVIGGAIGEPYHLWFSSRSAAETWTAPALFYTGDHQIIAPAAAIGPNGTAVVTWQEWLTRIASASYSFATGAWSQPLTVTAAEQVDNRRVAFNEAGFPVAYFHSNNALNDDAEQKAELTSDVWSAPQTTTLAEASGASYSVTGGNDGLQVTPLHPSASDVTPPLFSRPRCEDYPNTTVLSTKDDGRVVVLPLQQQVELTLQTIGPGRYGDPIISSPTVTFEGTARPREQIPAGPTQIYLFRTIADGEALITIPHTGGREPFTITLRCCAE